MSVHEKALKNTWKLESIISLDEKSKKKKIINVPMRIKQASKQASKKKNFFSIVNALPLSNWQLLPE